MAQTGVVAGLRRTTITASVVLAVSAGSAAAHPERHTSFPNPAYGQVPAYRTTGPQLIVCAPDSGRRILRGAAGPRRTANLRLLEACRYRSVQAAIDAAPNGARIAILPGVYRGTPAPDLSEVDGLLQCGPPEPNAHGDARKGVPEKYLVTSHQYQVNCPAVRNAFWIMGDSTLRGQRWVNGSWISDCTRHCFLQIEGTGTSPADVVLRGDRRRPDVLHVDRADGTYLRNFTVEGGAFNGINVIETNGYAISSVVSRRNQNYGVLTFTTDHGLYDHVTTYENGHAGVYPGSTADGMDRQGDCTRYAVEMRHIDSHHNTYGYSGTAANSVWVHDSSFHDNATGLSTDSLSSAHPAMPQDCARWERNRIYSNNLNPFTASNAAVCKAPYDQRPERAVCPYFAAPVGSGVQIAGANANLVADNWIYGNRRTGIRMFWIPGVVRYPDPRADDRLIPGVPYVADTSFANHFVGNVMGRAPDGSSAPNGADFWWDGEGDGNCVAEYAGNRFSGVRLPDCGDGVAPAGDPRRTTIRPYVVSNDPAAATRFSPGDPREDAADATCALFDPRSGGPLPGCSWMRSPP